MGKTYAMLQEAAIRARPGRRCRRRPGRDARPGRNRGADGRPRGAAAQDASTIAARTLDELDLDALLARKPQLALIDELAHTNVPGSRHLKRWQDVIEVLDAGIDVTTALNIQHIESLNDAVARITGVRVQETVPDAVVARADDIELIDLPPEELIARLRDGKVYRAGTVGRALDNFFTRPNLTALRELALRTAASRVDAQMLSLMRQGAVQGPVADAGAHPRLHQRKPAGQIAGARRQAHGRARRHPLDRRHRGDAEARGAARDGAPHDQRGDAAGRVAGRRNRDAARRRRRRRPN